QPFHQSRDRRSEGAPGRNDLHGAARQFTLRPPRRDRRFDVAAAPLRTGAGGFSGTPAAALTQTRPSAVGKDSWTRVLARQAARIESISRTKGSGREDATHLRERA